MAEFLVLSKAPSGLTLLYELEPTHDDRSTQWCHGVSHMESKEDPIVLDYATNAPQKTRVWETIICVSSAGLLAVALLMNRPRPPYQRGVPGASTGFFLLCLPVALANLVLSLRTLSKRRLRSVRALIALNRYS